MKKILHIDKIAEVDLYYNDLYGLNQSLKKFKQSSSIKN